MRKPLVRMNVVTMLPVCMIVMSSGCGCQPPCEPIEPVTTVLLVRHAERGNDHLTGDGEKRAEALAHVICKAGVTAVYSTDTTRTRQTVEEVVESHRKGKCGPKDPGLPLITYSDAGQLAMDVCSDHLGEVLLVVDHSGSSSVGEVAVIKTVEALGGDPTRCSIGREFDNLCVVTFFDPPVAEANVVNLQYGSPSP